MVLRLWLSLHAVPLTAVWCKCAPDYYYDGLVEECKHCSTRCNSPPHICTTFCTSCKSSSNESQESNNVQLILVLLFAFVCAFSALTVIVQVLRKKTCQELPCKEPVETSEGERSCDDSEQTEVAEAAATENGLADPEQETAQTHYNSSLPVPSTEEGTTALVTTKTVQIHNCTARHIEDVTLNIWRSGFIQ
ncbi:tumor necrosis factor receptor superfamily member 17 [Chanos chanos]|uniref:Tumor necrosis factor receptor superfamily member 17 n=1 Tax=Chanos chanos TaxID=29144 RepID=A0A6J2VGK0_CHACN|nr:tumor necrosis factor receptor superfamily member 17 [Chanos chanos]